MSAHRKVYLVTDGASKGNPGPSAIGFGIYDESWKPLEEYAESIGLATNNEAEYKALIKGLLRCMRYCKGEVEHFTDSRLVAKQTSGEWIVRAPNLRPLVEEIFKRKLQFDRVIHKHAARTDPKIQRIDRIVNEELGVFL